MHWHINAEEHCSSPLSSPGNFLTAESGNPRNNIASHFFSVRVLLGNQVPKKTHTNRAPGSAASTVCMARTPNPSPSPCGVAAATFPLCRWRNRSLRGWRHSYCAAEFGVKPKCSEPRIYTVDHMPAAWWNHGETMKSVRPSCTATFFFKMILWNIF